MPRPLDYIDVSTRLAEMRETYPELTLQQVKLEFVEVNGMSFVVYTAAAFRTPGDPCPGHGTAWEPIPGPTNFTRDSEVQNSETSAWGRALVAIGASTKSGIASAEEVENRSGEAQGRQTATRGPQNASGGPKPGHPTPDEERILEAARLAPEVGFLQSLAQGFAKHGSLTDNQVRSGLDAAGRILDQPRVPVTPAGDEWPPEDERF